MRSFPHRARVLAGIAIGSLALLLAACTGAPPGPASSPTASPSAYTPGQDDFTPVVASVLAPPIAAKGTDGRVHLAYELLLTNAVGQAVTIDSVQASSGADVLQSLSGAGLAELFRTIGVASTGTVIPAGGSAMVWMDAAVASKADVPSRLTHAIAVTMSQAIAPLAPKQLTETSVAPVRVPAAAAIVIGPPLKGAGWFDGNGCCTLTAHRGAVSPINGAFHAPERWAIDYVKLTPQRALYTGDKESLQSYPSFGQDVVAVADGPIVAMTTDRPEQTPGANPTGLTLDEYGGNYIVQSIGGGAYAFYAHLEPGDPLHLRVGQVLKRGQTLGLLGNSGNSDTPHLHFHLMDSPSPLASNGIPFVIDAFTLDGTAAQEQIDASSTGAAITADTSRAGPRRDEAPLVGDLMTYPR